MYLPYFKIKTFNVTLANNFITFEQLSPEQHIILDELNKKFCEP